MKPELTESKIDDAIFQIKTTRFWWTNQAVKTIEQAKKDREDALTLLKDMRTLYATHRHDCEVHTAGFLKPNENRNCDCGLTEIFTEYNELIKKLSE